MAQELLRQGVLQPGAFSYSTLQRRLAQAGLDRRSLRAGAALIGGPTKAYELPLPNLLWMADAMYGPTLKLAEGKSQRSVLFAILDDHYRLADAPRAPSPAPPDVPDPTERPPRTDPGELLPEPLSQLPGPRGPARKGNEKRPVHPAAPSPPAHDGG